MGGDYSREAIILNISVTEGAYSREAINQGTAIIRGEFDKTHENDFFFPQNSWDGVRLALTVLLVTTPSKFCDIVIEITVRYPVSVSCPIT